MTEGIRRRIARVALGVVGGAILLSLGALAFVYVQGVRPVVGVPEYVALGSSYASGPGLAQRVPGSPVLCGRSDHNYAHLLARRRGLALVDVTCAGATTRHVLRGGQYFQSAQLDAITSRTRLVTITVGGNDVAYLGNLVARSCGASRWRPERLLGVCTPTANDVVVASFERLPDHLREIAAEVHRRAPQSRLLFVDYLSVLPATGTCPQLGMSVTDVAQGRHVATELTQALASAAQASGASLVDIAALSRDHGVCAADPWVNGRHPAGLTTAALHPNERGMEEVATAIDRMLARTEIGHRQNSDEMRPDGE